MAKKTGNSSVGGDKKTRDKVNRKNPRGKKRGGNNSKIRGKNTKTQNFIIENGIKKAIGIPHKIKGY
jgi:hypothetical protein